MDDKNNKKEVALSVTRDSAFGHDQKLKLIKLVFSDDANLILLANCCQEEKNVFASFVREIYFVNADATVVNQVASKVDNASKASKGSVIEITSSKGSASVCPDSTAV